MDFPIFELVGQTMAQSPKVPEPSIKDGSVMVENRRFYSRFIHKEYPLKAANFAEN